MVSAWAWILVTTLLCFAHGATTANAVCSTTVHNKIFAECKDLPTLNASLAWTLNKAANTIDFAFTEDMQNTAGWVAWGINPTSTLMAGTQALVAFQNSTSVAVREYNVTRAVQTTGAELVPGPVSVKYSNYSAMQAGSTVVTIFTTLQLTPGQSFALNHVWNRGTGISSTSLALMPHATTSDNLESRSTIDVSSGTSVAYSAPHQRLKNTHGIINAISWGFLLPVGVMAARYLRPFAFADPLWFYMHVSCQITGYILGVVGLGLGLKLQHYATPIKYKHRNLGISIFVLASLQMLSIFLRPKKDHKVRKYWNIYHHTIGYATIILIIINIFEGFHLLYANPKYRRAYLAVICLLAVIAFIMEIITWVLWFRKRQLSRSTKRIEDTSGSQTPNSAFVDIQK